MYTFIQIENDALFDNGLLYLFLNAYALKSIAFFAFRAISAILAAVRNFCTCVLQFVKCLTYLWRTTRCKNCRVIMSGGGIGTVMIGILKMFPPSQKRYFNTGLIHVPVLSNLWHDLVRVRNLS